MNFSLDAQNLKQKDKLLTVIKEKEKWEGRRRKPNQRYLQVDWV